MAILVASHASLTSTRTDNCIMSDPVDFADVTVGHELIERLRAPHIIVTALTAVLASDPSVVATAYE